MQSPLETLFGRTAALVLLYLQHHGEGYARGIAADLNEPLASVQNQLKRLSSAGVLVAKQAGRTQLYRFNPKSLAATKLAELVKVYYKGLTLGQREQLFATRRRPRRPGKKVIRRAERP